MQCVHAKPFPAQAALTYKYASNMVFKSLNYKIETHLYCQLYLLITS